MAKKILSTNAATTYLSVVFNGISQGVIVSNRHGIIVDINPFAVRLFGYTKEEILGKNVSEILHPQVPNLIQGDEVVMQENGLYNGIRKDGTKFRIELSMNNDGIGQNINTIYFIKPLSGDFDTGRESERVSENSESSADNLKNVTTLPPLQSITASQSLENGLAFQKAILDYAGALIIVTDIHGIIIYFNHEACVSTGYSETELINKETPMLFHDKEEIARKRSEFIALTGKKGESDFSAFVEKAKRGIHEEEEFTYIRKDKTRFPVSLTITAVKDNHENIIGFIGVAVDISERRKAENELKEIKELFLQLLRNYPDGIVSIIDNDYRFVYTGGTLHDQLNAEQRQLIGAELFPKFPTSLRNLIKERLKNVIATGNPISNLELPEPIAGGNYILDAFPLKEKEDKVRKIGLVIRNITSLKQKENELRKALKKERELGELKSRFVSMASHEFRTPLSTILSSAYLVEKYTAAEDQHKRERHLERIVSAVNLLTDILNDFLSLGKIEEGKIEPKYAIFDLKEILNEAIREIEPSLKKGQQIVYTHEGNTIVFLDKSILKFIFLNLVSNARKFSPENSLIEIKTTRSNGQIVLKVRDHGIGISKQDQAHLMERFFRGANATNIQGTGLGLNIVSKYVEMLEGAVSFESELEKGTEFTITLCDKSK